MYEIICSDGAIMPRHWSGRLRTKQEAEKMVERLNKNAEHDRKYHIKNISK